MKTSNLIVALSIVLAVGVSGHAFGQGRGHGYHHGKDERDNKKRGDHRSYSKGNLAQRITKVTQADSVQATKMKPAIDRSVKRLEALRAEYNKREQKVMDSLKLQLKPFLKDEQQKRLEEYIGKGK